MKKASVIVYYNEEGESVEEIIKKILISKLEAFDGEPNSDISSSFTR